MPFHIIKPTLFVQQCQSTDGKLKITKRKHKHHNIAEQTSCGRAATMICPSPPSVGAEARHAAKQTAM